jgi:hypothetical protein
MRVFEKPEQLSALPPPLVPQQKGAEGKRKPSGCARSRHDAPFPARTRSFGAKPRRVIARARLDNYRNRGDPWQEVAGRRYRAGGTPRRPPVVPGCADGDEQPAIKPYASCRLCIMLLCKSQAIDKVLLCYPLHTARVLGCLGKQPVAK